MFGILLLGVAYGITETDTAARKLNEANAKNLAIIALQAKREEMRQFLLARGMLATEEILDKFRY